MGGKVLQLGISKYFDAPGQLSFLFLWEPYAQKGYLV